MAKILNLGREKKKRRRAAQRAEADANAVRHGLPGHEKRRQKTEAELAHRRLEGHRLDEDE